MNEERIWDDLAIPLADALNELGGDNRGDGVMLLVAKLMARPGTQAAPFKSYAITDGQKRLAGWHRVRPGSGSYRSSLALAAEPYDWQSYAWFDPTRDRLDC